MLKAGRMVMASFPRGPLCSSPFSRSQTDFEIIPISCWYGPCLSKLVLVWTGAEKGPRDKESSRKRKESRLKIQPPYVELV